MISRCHSTSMVSLESLRSQHHVACGDGNKVRTNPFYSCSFSRVKSSLSSPPGSAGASALRCLCLTKRKFLSAGARMLDEARETWRWTASLLLEGPDAASSGRSEGRGGGRGKRCRGKAMQEGEMKEEGRLRRVWRGRGEEMGRGVRGEKVDGEDSEEHLVSRCENRVCVRASGSSADYPFWTGGRSQQAIRANTHVTAEVCGEGEEKRTWEMFDMKEPRESVWMESFSLPCRHTISRLSFCIRSVWYCIRSQGKFYM